MKVTLKTARINNAITQAKAAKLLGLSPSVLAEYEHGSAFPDVLIIQKMEKLYGVHYDDIIFLPENYGLTVTNEQE